MTILAEDAALRPGDLDLDTDVVIVGSGASGAVLAAELADAGQQVLLLEEGGYAEDAGQRSRSYALRHAWRSGGGMIALGIGDTPSVTLALGRGVGGSSRLTGGVCFRTPERVLDVWVRDHGLRELSPRALEPCFDAVEKALHVEEVPVEMRSKSTRAFARGAERRGYPLKSLRRNTQGCDGCGRCAFVCPKDAKRGVDLNYLPRAVEAGARIYSHCLVTSIDLSGDRAVGVSGRVCNGPEGRPEGFLRVRARRVVLAAGGLHTPLLLLRSGIGRRFGQVGRNLTLHPGFRVFGLFDEEIAGWRGAFQSAYTDAFVDEGITLVSIYLPPAIFAAAVSGVGAEHHRRVSMARNIAHFGFMVHDSGGGRIRRSFGREPLVTYCLAKEDRPKISRGVKILAETFFEAGAREVFLPILGSEPMDADAFAKLDIDRIKRRHLECGSQHPLGSCRMGASPSRSVVGPDGETWDVRELFVVDGSIVPTSLGVNPQVSIMAMATRIAWQLRERPFIPQ